MASCGIDLIFNTEVTGSTSTHIGSARILPGTNSNISFRVMMGTTNAATASLEIKKFSDASTVVTIPASGSGLQDTLTSNYAISGLGIVDGWYDFHLSGSSGAGSTLIKGISISLS